MPDKSLCTGGGLAFCLLAVQFWMFMLSMALMICFVVLLLLIVSYSVCLVGGSYALRVSPAVTRLTVCRRPQVLSKRNTRAVDQNLGPAVNRQPGYRRGDS